MQVNLCGRDIFVPEKFLDGPQIRPALEQMRCKTMASRKNLRLRGFSASIAWGKALIRDDITVGTHLL